MNNFGEFLKELRGTASLKKVATYLGEKPAYLSELEKGNVLPSKQALLKLIEFYNLNDEQIEKMYDAIRVIPFGKEKQNIRELVLSLDTENKRTLSLLRGNSDEIDKFTLKNFFSSDDIREYFRPIITKYLKENEEYIGKIVLQSHKAYRGRVVLLEYNETKFGDLQIQEKRVLYRDYRVIYDEALKHQFVMQKAISIDKASEDGLLSDFIIREINGYNYGNTTSVRAVKSYVNSISRKYDLMRLVISSYIKSRTVDNRLKTPAQLYGELKQKEIEIISLEPLKKELDESVEEPYVLVDGVRYNLDELPYDVYELDQFSELSGTLPDGIKFSYKHKTTE